MKYKIITSSELGMDCWSAKRFTDGCHECDRVKQCKLPEAAKGRVRLAQRLLRNAQFIMEEAKRRLKRVEVGGPWE